MRLTEKAIGLIKDVDIRKKLADALDCTDQTIIRQIKDNHRNLTTAAALKVIREETGLRDEEILEEDVKSQVA